MGLLKVQMCEIVLDFQNLFKCKKNIIKNNNMYCFFN
jgi:hypothetical protein